MALQPTPPPAPPAEQQQSVDAVEQDQSSSVDPSNPLTPPSAILHSLISSGEIIDGYNETSFVILLSNGSESRVSAGLYLWHVDSSLVVFDIDGTVTTSDVAGQLGQLFGIPFVHAAVCEFACHLHARGYR